MVSESVHDLIYPVLDGVADALKAAVERAYQEGMKAGEAKAAADLAVFMQERLGSPPLQMGPPRPAAPPPAQSSERRKYGYGVVTGVIRNVINAERHVGVTIDGIIGMCAERFAVTATKGQVREALKRMSASEEIKSINRKWYPTPSFRKDLIVTNAEENEAPNGDADGASDAGGAGTPPNDSSAGFKDLLG